MTGVQTCALPICPDQVHPGINLGLPLRRRQCRRRIKRPSAYAFFLIPIFLCNCYKVITILVVLHNNIIKYSKTNKKIFPNFFMGFRRSGAALRRNPSYPAAESNRYFMRVGCRNKKIYNPKHTCTHVIWHPLAYGGVPMLRSPSPTKP